jgi:nucleotide-binding universal stress UspA family protein
VLGPHARGAGIALLGTTADRVLRTADVPCLVVRSELALPLGRVVAPLDLSQPARGALDAALAWAEALGPAGGGAEVRVVHVMPRAFGGQGLEVGRARVGPEMHRMVEEAARVAGAVDDVLVREELLWGERPAAEIVRYAEREGADLLVLATHGYGAIKRALLGSVAAAVARDAGCSVLLVPPALWAGTEEGGS